MLFARWQQHLRFGSGFPYAPLKAMVTKISKWSRIQDSFRITPKIESLAVFAIPDIPRIFQKDRSITFWVILLTHKQTNKQTNKLESSQSPQTSTKVMLFARWQHHIRFGSSFPYAPLKAMLTKISKRSRIQDDFRITPKIESLVVFAISDIPRKFQKDPSITFWVILLTHRQTDRQSQAKT